MGVEQRLLAGDVAGIVERGAHVEVVAPARELEAVVAHALRERRELGERQVGPLAGEEGHWTRHGGILGAGRARVPGTRPSRRRAGCWPAGGRREPLSTPPHVPRAGPPGPALDVRAGMVRAV